MGELSKVCSQIVLKCLYLARIGRPDIRWSVNKLARSITKWTKACDTWLSRLISYIHHTCEYKQYCHVGINAKQSRLGLFQDSEFAGDLEDSKSASGGTLCIFGSHTFVPISWICKKQTSVLESENISLDAGLRLDGIPALDFQDLIVAVLHGNTYQNNQARGDLCTNKREVRAAPHALQKRKKSHGMIDLDNVDFTPSNVNSSRQEALLYVFEDNEAVIKMIIKGRSPTMRHVPEPTELLLISCSLELIWTPTSKSNTLTPKTNSQTILTKEIFTRVEWNHLLCVVQLYLFQFHQLSWRDVEKNARRCRWRKSHSKIEADDEIRSRDAAKGILMCLPLLHQKARGKPDMKVKYLLSSWNEQQPRTRRLVMGACPSNYSEWNTDEKWSSQEWKSDEMLEARTVRPVAVNNPAGSFTQHTDRFVINNDDMDSNTVTESDLFVKVTIILAQGEWSSAKDVGPIIKRCNTRQQQTFFNMWNVYVFWLYSWERICFENLHSIKNTGNNLTLKPDVRHYLKSW